MLIREVMSTNVQTVARTESLRTAVTVMLRTNVEAVVLTEDGDPNGLVTERRALAAGVKTDEPFSEIPLTGFGTGFPNSVSPDTTVLFGIGRIVSAAIDVLPVLDGLDLVGLVSREDMLGEYSNLRREAIATNDQRAEWESARPFNNDQ